MGTVKPKKDKWYTVKPRILEMSSRQVALMALLSLFLITGFLILSLYIPPQDRSTFLRNTMPPFIGMLIVSGGTWIYKRFKPDAPGFQGYSRKRYWRETIYGIVIVVSTIGLWLLLHKAGYSSTVIAIVFAGFGFVLLSVALLVSIVLNLRNKKVASTAGSMPESE